MGQPYHGGEMDRPPKSSGSVKRARERAQAGLPRGSPPPPAYETDTNDEMLLGDLRAPPRRPMGAFTNGNGGQSRLPRPRPAAALDGRNGNIGQAISRPTQVPQWPLPGPITPPSSSDSEPYRPPPGKPQQAPQRPPRPSQVPSILDQSRPQDPTPVFLTPQSIPENGVEPEYSSSTPQTPSSRFTNSSMGSIPDFPVPVATPTTGPPRRSANLGPPPSSRRGASSFYSSASFVSPIPEESPAARSHESYASSAAMPDSWPGGSPEASPTFYEDTDTEKSRDSAYDDFGDESKLVRSASIGKRGKPSLVNTKSIASSDAAGTRPAPSPVQPFNGGTGYVEASTESSNTLPMSREQPTDAAKDRLTPDAILGAYAAASATDLTEVRMASQSPQPFSRLSAIRRPPKLDIDAVRDMEARGSMTSLPDLIRRATRLAHMIDRGKRPASRFENFNDYLDEKSDARAGEKDVSDTRHQSGLSDMLAAFPPPGQPQPDRQSRGSWFRTTSWPLAPGRQDGTASRSSRRGMTPSDEDQGKKKGRRCCGLPLWAFLLVVLVILCLVAAAIVVPLEFFVFRKHSSSQSELSQCQASLTCQNGGTNVISQGVCSCICTNGFTGSDCSTGGSDGCTTTDLVSSDGSTSISNVTLGQAIPRLIADASTNFSIPLSGKAILAKLNSADLSCIAQNSLVTFDGQDARAGETTSKEAVVEDDDLEAIAEKRHYATTTTSSVSVLTITGEIIAATTLVLDNGTPTAVATTESKAMHTAYSETKTTRSAESTSSTTTASAPTSTSTSTFTITQDMLDFARVAVLYILQEESASSAESAQTHLQRFFTNADSTQGVTENDASDVQIGGNNTINFVAFNVNIGDGAIGGKTKRDLDLDSIEPPLRYVARHGGSVLLQR